MTGVNLIPTQRLAAKRRRSRINRWLVGTTAYAALALAACIGANVAWGTDYHSTAGDLAQTSERISHLTTKAADLRRRLADAESLRQTAQAVSDQPDWSILLAILSETLGHDVTLRELRLQPDRRAAAPAAAPTSTPQARPPAPLNATSLRFVLELRGVARSQPAVAQFVLRLQQIGLFDEVKLIRTGREPLFNASAVTFDITATIHEYTAGPTGRAQR
jgi:Tfp pilus assembly protein PilN